MKELQYPFDSEYILKKRKKIKKELLSDNSNRIKKKIAVLGGSTTHDVIDMMELFMLNIGIEPSFFESEYNQYWEDVIFDNPKLLEFEPDIIYIHTSTRNIKLFPSISSSSQEISDYILEEYSHLEKVWIKISKVYNCPIIQNNFEQMFYRLMGNKDISDIHGKLNFINVLNTKIVEYAQTHDNFYINDINYLASCYGLQKWSDPFYWHMYKYACAVPAIPELAYNVVNIIKSLLGKNKKTLVLDLDNTLWGGVIGDDGVDNIEIGQETSMGQLYSEFQKYIKSQRDIGVLLAVNSKNNEENARAGFRRPDSILKEEDFVSFKANWNNKDRNIIEIASDLNLGTDSFVFVDDNPAERHIVESQLSDVIVPEMEDVVQYINILDRSGFFEVTTLSEDDIKRNEMYKINAERKRQEASFENYEEYLFSLDMNAEIDSFNSLYMSRIAQLTNKSNQFNLTTKRCTQTEIESYALDPNYITLYGKLTDKFGDNGVVSVVYGHLDEDKRNILHIDLWLMSCRVLKRDMEYAMMDELVRKCRDKKITILRGYYYPTEKNGMVKDFYEKQGFVKICEDEKGNTTWQFDISSEYVEKNIVINVN